MWTEEDEEKYKDLECIRGLMKWKRTVKGDLVNDTYIAEKKVSFELMPFFNQEISLYLPEGAPGKHCAETFCYFDDMGEYEEYVLTDEAAIITFEKSIKDEFNLLEELDAEKAYEHLIEELEERYCSTVALFWESFLLEKKHLKVYVIRAMAGVEDSDYEGLIYCISCKGASYRLYLASCKWDIELLDILGKKIVENIICHKII